MAFDIFRSSYLTDLLDAAAIPHGGVSVVSTSPLVVNIQYTPAATQQQIVDGEAIKAAFDWRRRRPLSLSAVRTTLLNALTGPERNNLILALIAHLLLDDARRAARVLTFLGLSGVAVDEVVPD